MWEENRGALDALRLGETESVLDVGCGSGALTRVLTEELDGLVVGCDADTELLCHNTAPTVRGDAYSLPFVDESFETVVCQALLVNLGEPERAVGGFVRVASGRVGCIEPDNSEVRVESTVEYEPEVARRTRRRYIDGVSTDVSLGAGVAEILRDSELGNVTVERYDHELTLEPPYDEDDVRAVRRKAKGEPLRERRGEMEGSVEEIDALREEWRSVGREAARQMEEGKYVRRETIPFYVVVGEL